MTQPTWLTWPVAAFAGLIAGILAAWGATWGLVFLGVALLGRRRLILVAVGFALLGGARERLWHDAPNVLAAWDGAAVTLSGYWDGSVLRLDEPRSAVALSPKPRVAPGQLVVRGHLGAPGAARNPGEFDYALWLRERGVRMVLFGAEVKKSVPENNARSWFSSGVRAGLPTREADLMTAIELGDKEGLETHLLAGRPANEAFARSGLSHLMALSGQNVALIVAALSLVLVRTPLGAHRFPILLLGLVFYVWLAGASPSLVRAALQGGAVLAGLWVGRGKLDGPGTLGLAGIVSLLWSPGWVFDVGFQLSFLAAGSLLLTPRLEQKLPSRWPGWLRVGLAATLLAELATLPVVAHGFHGVPSFLVSLPANLLAAPIMAALVPLGFLAGLLGPLAGPVNLVTLPLAKVLLLLVEVFGRGPIIPWGGVSAAGFALYAVFGVAFVLWLRARLPARALLGITLACLLGAALPGKLAKPRELIFLDVGQGDATLVRLGEFSALIDAGGTPRGDFDVGARTVVPTLRSLGVFHLDVAVATHWDADHAEGLAGVLREMRVGELWISRRPTDEVGFAVLRAAAERRVLVREVRRGDFVRAGDATLRVLWPTSTLAKEDNENSVALRLESPDFRAAFLGDLSSEVEDRLGLGPLDVLKIAHHGSRFSTSQALIDETRPRMAVVSVGRNTYGHPNAEVLGRLRGAGARVWRTDESGAVRLPLP